MEDNKPKTESNDIAVPAAEIGTVSEMQDAVPLRKLKARHIQLIAIGGTIGSGLFLSIGAALATGGPLSLVLGYTLTGVAIFAMMQCLGEMTTWLPMPGAIGQLMSRFVDESLGFAIGWNQWYNVSIGVCAEISAAVTLVSYWDSTTSPAAWISIILAATTFVNISPVRIYGEVEFWFALIKVITIVGLLILAFVLCLGGGPNHDRLGFTYWDYPGAMNDYISTGATGRFLGFFSTLVNAAFAYGGIEQIAVAAGEVSDPRKSVPDAVRRVFWRIMVFYVVGALAVGVLVPSNNPNLLTASGVSASPWVIAIQNAGIPVLPSIINAVIITSASSAANANMYVGSRYLYALAVRGQAPKIFTKCTKAGVPIYSVALTCSIGLLTYMTVSSSGAQVFQWFSNLAAIAYMITWNAICYTYIRFRKAMDYQGIDPSTQDFRAPYGTILAWFGTIFFSMVILFNGFAVFTYGHWSVENFFTAYIGIPILLVLYLGWKFLKRAKALKISEVDLHTGRDEMHANDVAVEQLGN